MAINGRINVDVLFHDTDGTTSLKVVSLEDSTEYTTGKVAIVTGTVGTAAVAISTQPSSYKDASGSLVSFSSVERVVFLSSRNCLVNEDDTQSQVARSLGRITVGDCAPSLQQSFHAHTSALLLGNAVEDRLPRLHPPCKRFLAVRNVRDRHPAPHSRRSPFIRRKSHGSYVE